MSDLESHIHRLKLPSAEMAVLAAETNVIGTLEPGAFNETVHLPQIRHIIASVDPIIEAGTNWGVQISTRSGTPGMFSRWAETNTGANMPMSERGQRRSTTVLLGKLHAVGLGNFILEKVGKKHGLYALNMQPMMDYGLITADPSLARPYRVIFYEPKSLDPLEMQKVSPVYYWFIQWSKSQRIWRDDEKVKALFQKKSGHDLI